MIYLLDTNVCIVYLNRPKSIIRDKLITLEDTDIAICSIVKAELSYGAVLSTNPERTFALQKSFIDRFVSLPLDDKSARINGDIRADLKLAGTPIGPYDSLIAAIALANDLTLVTHNVREFSRVKGLRIEDWEAAS